MKRRCTHVYGATPQTPSSVLSREEVTRLLHSRRESIKYQRGPLRCLWRRTSRQ